MVTNSHLPGYEDHFGIYVLGAVTTIGSRRVRFGSAFSVTNVEDDGFVGYAPPNYSPYTAADYNNFRLQAPGSFGVGGSKRYVGRRRAMSGRVWRYHGLGQVSNEGAFVSLSPDIVGRCTASRPMGKRSCLSPRPLVLRGPRCTHSRDELRDLGMDSYIHLIAVVDDPDVSGTGGQGLAKECDEADNEVMITLENLCP